MAVLQEAFDPDNYGGRKKAMQVRNKRAKTLRAEGFIVGCWTLANQQRGYSGLGTIRDCSCRNVFMLNFR